MQTDPSTQFEQERKIAKGAEPIVKVTVFKDDAADEYVEKQITSPGTISRSVAYDTGKFSPGSLSLQIDNKDGHLFDNNPNSKTWGKRYITDKKISVEVGFRLKDGTEEYLPVYDGEIIGKTDNIQNRISSISTQDIMKKILDFTIAKKIPATTVFNYDPAATDNRLIQSTVKFGEHNLLTASSKELFERNNPLFLTLCFPNISNGAERPGYPGDNYDAKHLWWDTIINQHSTSALENGVPNVYIWDYVQDPPRWSRVTTGNSFIGTTAYKYIVFSNAAGSIKTTATPANFTWTDYLTGAAGTYWDLTGTGLDDLDKLDPMVATEIIPYDVSYYNPVGIIYRLLLSGLIGLLLSPSQVDVSIGFPGSLVLSNSFDNAYNALDLLGLKMLTNVTKETSVLSLIEQISLSANITFMSTQRDSSSVDHRIKTIFDIPVASPAIPNVLDLSEAGTATSIIKDRTRIKNKVIASMVDYSTDTREEFTIVDEDNSDSMDAYGELRLDLTSNNLESDVVVYDSRTALQNIAQRILIRLAEPEKILSVDTDLIALPYQLKDIITARDLDNYINDNFQVKEQSLNLSNFAIALELSRFGSLFGPDTLNPHKWWAFCDNAYCDNSAGNDYNGHIGGSGVHALATIGNAYMDVVGETIPDTVEIGMGVEVDAPNDSEENDYLASVNSTTQVGVDETWAATHTDKHWSIGETFHCF